MAALGGDGANEECELRDNTALGGDNANAKIKSDKGASRPTEIIYFSEAISQTSMPTPPSELNN